ncbi:Multiple C2 and transmembrane domain-containing protein [Eumeta japonica]|uniref:Multiple C2 and transmembrane domain-containing protein n=1 Tax=Eumeta variegata TaxID=151549 RepID=A0A4C1ZHR6_EUMVA|nr:Multiple C2 and transmembrane domain-containing protein [Eumeta japonica]
MNKSENKNLRAVAKCATEEDAKKKKENGSIRKKCTRAPMCVYDMKHIITHSHTHTPYIHMYDVCACVYKYVRAWYNTSPGDGGAVGELRVTVHGARGLPLSALGARPLALCVLELDNARVQTHAVRAATDPHWNHTYTFDVDDIMSTLDVTVYDEMVGNKGEILGTVNIPLLWINNGEMKWYALKDRNQKIAKGNCPRILLEMHLVWNPVNASLRLFRPKKCKYIKAPAKFDIALVLSNLEFVRDIFNFLVEINEIVKDLLEWDSRDHCVVGLVAWIGACYIFELWMLPLMLLGPFFYHWIRLHLYKSSGYNINGNLSPSEEVCENVQYEKNDKTLKARIQDLHEMTLTITRGIDYMHSIYEKLKNLANFSVPYLSYLVIVLLLTSSLLFYFIPINFVLMGLGVYKFMRKYMNPRRIANNDIIDFLSRVPDDDALKLWKEYSVPEPVQGVFQKKI